MEKPVIIIGAKGIGKAALDIFLSHDIVVYGFLDDNKELHQTEINQIPVLGYTDDENLLKLIGKKCDVFIAVDENVYKKSLVKILNENLKVMPVNAFHTNTFLAESIQIGHGNLVNSGVIISADVKIKNYCIFNSNVTIEWDCVIDNYVQIGAGSIINAKVIIGQQVFIGSGVTIISGINIGSGAQIGAGSVVINDIKPGEIVFGNPAKPVSN